MKKAVGFNRELIPLLWRGALQGGVVSLREGVEQSAGVVYCLLMYRLVLCYCIYKYCIHSIGISMLHSILLL